MTKRSLAQEFAVLRDDPLVDIAAKGVEQLTQVGRVTRTHGDSSHVRQLVRGPERRLEA